MDRVARAARHAFALLLALCLCKAPAAANSITFTFWPDADPDHAVFCAVRLAEGRLRASELRGFGITDRKAMEWFASRAETETLMAALQALSTGTLQSIDPTGSRFPAPPYASAIWMARSDAGLISGLYMQPGLDLPAELAAVIAGLLPGGLCAGVAQGQSR